MNVTPKNPENIIRAVAELDDVELDVIGDGELHDDLRALASALGVADRVRFERAVPNDELCERLPTYDLFVVHSEFWELSKSLLEALLSGVPAVANRRRGAPVPELADGLVLLVGGTKDSYRDAIMGLVADEDARARLGRGGRAVAETRWAVGVTEARFVEHYRRVMDGHR